MTKKNIKELIEQINAETGLNTYEMAAKLNCSHNTIREYWRGIRSVEACKIKMLEDTRAYMKTKEYADLIKAKGVKNLSEKLFIMCEPGAHEELIKLLNSIKTGKYLSLGDVKGMKIILNAIESEKKGQHHE